MKTQYQIELQFTEPISGYWDGGKKSALYFSIDGEPQKDKKGYFIKVGSWDANYWFYVGAGKTKLQNEKQVLSSAIKKIKSQIKDKSKIKSIKIVKGSACQTT